ncbi:MAG: hypothetical protein DI547_01590 [Sphingobium sp.]|jgi:hypothetical protein|nr:MAG: hypothetical protein DI547_01590 [Sphingobium sp.]
MGFAELFRSRESEDNRKGKRFKVLLPVHLAQAGKGAPGKLIEISNEGARAQSLSQPEQDAPIEIEWEGKMLAAKVIWVKGEHFGLSFERRLTNNQLLAMLAN